MLRETRSRLRIAFQRMCWDIEDYWDIFIDWLRDHVEPR